MKFAHFNGFNNKVASVRRPDAPAGSEFVQFDLFGFAGWGSDQINDDWVDVVVNSYPERFLVTGDTAGAHQLVGQRRWSVDVNPLSDGLSFLTIRTEAWERVRTPANALGWRLPFLGGEANQHVVWDSYFKNIGEVLSSKYDAFGGTPASGSFTLPFSHKYSSSKNPFAPANSKYP